ncbi:MAG: two pore domain potassium channel family protein [Burkholderiaceae bacterium]|nr:two pore domain potassium channel family protein [Burkholderiaceae bacterium]
MLIVVLACALLLSATTFIHYDALRGLSRWLPVLRIASRSKLLIVLLAAFVAHALEIGVYGAALFFLIGTLGIGGLAGTLGFSFLHCLYFSAETYTSLGCGDLVPVGPVRLLAGTETHNGLLLIDWSASYTYLAMERFWREEA